MKLRPIHFSIVLILILFACGDSNSPSDILKQRERDVAAGNIDAALALYVNESGGSLTPAELTRLKGILRNSLNRLNNRGKLIDIKIFEEAINGNTAFVKGQHMLEVNGKEAWGELMNVKLIKINGSWKITFGERKN